MDGLIQKYLQKFFALKGIVFHYGTEALSTAARVSAAANQSLVLAAGSGTGASIIARARILHKQGAPAAKTTSTTLTAAEILGGIVTGNQGAAGTANYQLPTCSDLDAAVPDAAADDSFDFSLINLSTVAAEDVTITTNTGWTLNGEMTVESNDADRAASSGRFRARKTGSAAWSLYRLA